MPTFKYKNASGSEVAITLYTNKLSTPSFAVRHGGNTYYASATTTSNSNSSSLKFRYNNKTYFVQKTRTQKTQTFFYLNPNQSFSNKTILEFIGSPALGASEIKISGFALIGGGGGGGGGGGAAYSGSAYGTGGSGASGSSGSYHVTTGLAISVNATDKISITVGGAGSGGKGGSAYGSKVTTSVNQSAYGGSTGSAGGLSVITIDSKLIAYALGGTSGGGGGGASAQYSNQYPGSAGQKSEGKTCSAPNTSGFENNRIYKCVGKNNEGAKGAEGSNETVSAPKVYANGTSQFNDPQVTPIVTYGDIGKGGSGGAGGKIYSNGSNGGNGSNGAVKITLKYTN